MKTKGKTVFRFLLTLGCVFLVVLIIISIGIWAYLTYVLDSSIEDISVLLSESETPSKFYTVSKNGTFVEYGEGEIFIGKDKSYTEIESLPKDLINAFIAIEDKRFYSHIGFDPITTAKAAFKYIFSQGSSPGGSTITQQLIKNLTGNDDISVKRKLTEIMQAIKLEKVMEKDEILELYLNSIYLSQGVYGVSAAAKLYFNKSVEDLTLIESAAIAAITQAPSKWDPIVNPQNNAKRRNIILSEMYQNQMIESDSFSSAYGKELLISPSYEKVTAHTSSWYTDAAIIEAIGLLQDTLAVSSKVAEHHLFRGGYQIVVGVEPELQSFLESVYEDPLLFSKNGAQSSFVIMDSQNGQVLALVGGVGEKSANRVLNRATQTVRSPGSAIKPLSVFLPALEKGVFHYGTVFDDVPLYFGGKYPNSGWPKNASGVYHGLVGAPKALASSLNTASVSMLESVGIDHSYRFLEKVGISTLTDEDLDISALALGGMQKGTTLLEMTAAYTPLSNCGIYSEGRCVLMILDSGGNTVVDNRSRQSVVCSEESSQIMTKLLQGVVTRSDGTAYQGISKLQNYSEVAGKTGTTSYQYDRWFIGYTPNLIGGIWLGYDEPSSLSDIPGKAHMKVWDRIMTKAHEIMSGKEKLQFKKDLLIETKYCVYSGKIATEACYADPRQNAIAIGYFSKETLPSDYCSVHIPLMYCEEGEGIAGDVCPATSLSKVGLLLVERAFPVDVAIRDFEYTAMRLEEGYIPFIDKSEPYYKYYVKQGTNIGKGGRTMLYNRYCQLHGSGPN